MANFMYSAWFRDETLLPDEQDCEWVAMFIVEAESAEVALAWGDRIAHRYAVSHGEPFVRSYVENPATYSHCDGKEAPRSIAGDESSNPLDSMDPLDSSYRSSSFGVEGNIRFTPLPNDPEDGEG